MVIPMNHAQCKASRQLQTGSMVLEAILGPFTRLKQWGVGGITYVFTSPRPCRISDALSNQQILVE